jgi:hypothetical protein
VLYGLRVVIVGLNGDADLSKLPPQLDEKKLLCPAIIKTPKPMPRSRSAGLCHLDFFLGIFAPDFRASLSAMATACLRLLTFLPLPDFSVPDLCSFITLRTLLLPLDDADFFVAIVSS